jgi:hypothetical protein
VAKLRDRAAPAARRTRARHVPLAVFVIDAIAQVFPVHEKFLCPECVPEHKFRSKYTVQTALLCGLKPDDFSLRDVEVAGSNPVSPTKDPNIRTTPAVVFLYPLPVDCQNRVVCGSSNARGPERARGATT